MKTKLAKILGVVLSLALLSSLAMIAVPASAAGDPDVVNEWENLNMPMLNRWTDVKLIEQAEDGTIFISVAQYFPGDMENITGTYTWDRNGPGDSAYETFTATGDWDWWWDEGADGTYGIAIRYFDYPYVFDYTGTLTIDWEDSGNATLDISGTIHDIVGTSLSGTSDHNGTITDGDIDFYKGYLYFDGVVHSTLGTWYQGGSFGSESMYKSADGYMWEETCLSGVGVITAIEPSDNYSEDETVYVAIDTSYGADWFMGDWDDMYGKTTILRCTDAADEDVIPGSLGEISAGESGTRDASSVFDLDSYYDGEDVWLLAATNIDVFAIPDDNGLTTVWTDMELSQTLGGNYADDFAGPESGGVVIYWAEFAPDFASSGTIWALYRDYWNTNGYGLIARASGSTLWGTVITPEIISDGSRPARSNCDIEFAADYSSNANPDLFGALCFGGMTDADDIYSIECNFYGASGDITRFDVDPADRADFCSLEVSGNMLVAGIYDFSMGTTEVWYSHNDGITWNMASKNPTGEADETCKLLWSTAGSSNGDLFAATGGQQSALSISEDDGVNWTQIAFIDDDITRIRDLAFDPTSTSALMVTTNSNWDDSLWMTSDIYVEFPHWQRIFCENYNTNINFTNIDYSMDGTAVMVFDRWAEEIFRSSDDAMSFVPFKSTTAWGDINDWAIYDSSSVYAACDNGFWSTAVVGSDLTGVTLVSVALQTGFDPDDADNSVLVVGDDSGNVYVSYNAGDDLEVPVEVDGDGWPVHVAFGSDNTLYLTEGDDVYYAEIGATNVECDDANVIGDTSEPLTDWFVDIEVASDDDGDIVYVLNNDADLARVFIGDVNYEGREARWDIAWNFGGTTRELWVTPGGSNTAWTIDTSGDDTVNLIDDVLTGPVTGVTFSDIGPFSFTVSWDEMVGATDYQVRIYIEGDTDDWMTVFIDDNVLDLADYWDAMYILPPATDWIVEVRVNNGVEYYSDGTWDYPYSIGQEIEKSRWSSPASVMTDYYMTMPIPTNPAQGADEVSLTPSFGWSAVRYAVTYQFQLSDDPTFGSLIDSVSVTTTAYSYVGGDLDYDNDYYWRVRAVAPNGTTSDWSTYTETYFAITITEDMMWDIFWAMGPVDGLFDW
ncbi:MAG TPA: hypothetical protein G4O19_01035, partial [Dehalococcoidia bacterium]|nr:hypothetical protein [Dehalococcoidia bacterium]